MNTVTEPPKAKKVQVSDTTMSIKEQKARTKT